MDTNGDTSSPAGWTSHVGWSLWEGRRIKLKLLFVVAKIKPQRRLSLITVVNGSFLRKLLFFCCFTKYLLGLVIKQHLIFPGGKKFPLTNIDLNIWW